MSIKKLFTCVAMLLAGATTALAADAKDPPARGAGKELVLDLGGGGATRRSTSLPARRSSTSITTRTRATAWEARTTVGRPHCTSTW